MRKNHRLRIGVYNQHSADQLTMDESPVEYLQVRVSLFLIGGTTLGGIGRERLTWTIKIRASSWDDMVSRVTLTQSE